MVSIAITDWPDIKGIETLSIEFSATSSDITDWPDIKGIETKRDLIKKGNEHLLQIDPI